MKLPHLAHAHEISASRFKLYLQYGLITASLTEPRLGRPRPGLDATLDPDGNVRFQNSSAEPGAPIRSSWEWVERALMYSTIGRNLTIDELAANIRSEFCVT